MIKNQGQNGVEKQVRNKKPQETALLGQKQGNTTDQVSVGGLAGQIEKCA